MKEVLGLSFIIYGFVFGATMLLGFEFSLKEKIAYIFAFETFVCLVVFGSYLLAGA